MSTESFVSEWIVPVTILGMGIVTYLTRAGGFWIIERVTMTDRLETWLEAVPGAVLVALVAPELARGGLPEWGAAVAVVLVAARTGNVLLAMVVGIGGVWLLRQVTVAL